MSDMGKKKNDIKISDLESGMCPQSIRILHNSPARKIAMNSREIVNSLPLAPAPLEEASKNKQ